MADTKAPLKHYLKDLDVTVGIKRKNNAAMTLAALDPDNPWRIVRTMVDLVVEDDQKAFYDALESQDDLSGEQLAQLFMEMTGVAAGERPTRRSNASGPTTVKRAASKRSAAR